MCRHSDPMVKEDFPFYLIRKNISQNPETNPTSIITHSIVYLGNSSLNIWFFILNWKWIFVACCLLIFKKRRKIPVIFFRMGGSLLGTAWLLIKSDSVDDPMVFNPIYYAFAMTGTILSVVVLILTIEKVCLKIKQFEQEKNRKSILSSDTEYIE